MDNFKKNTFKLAIAGVLIFALGIFVGYGISAGAIKSIQGYLFNAASGYYPYDDNSTDANATNANATDSNATDANATDANAENPFTGDSTTTTTTTSPVFITTTTTQYIDEDATDGNATNANATDANSNSQTNSQNSNQVVSFQSDKIAFVVLIGIAALAIVSTIVVIIVVKKKKTNGVINTSVTNEQVIQQPIENVGQPEQPTDSQNNNNQ